MIVYKTVLLWYWISVFYRTPISTVTYSFNFSVAMFSNRIFSYLEWFVCLFPVFNNLSPKLSDQQTLDKINFMIYSSCKSTKSCADKIYLKAGCCRVNEWIANDLKENIFSSSTPEKLIQTAGVFSSLGQRYNRIYDTHLPFLELTIESNRPKRTDLLPCQWASSSESFYTGLN